jgi:hypothetical protein
MMKRVREMSLLVAFYLVISAAPAFAECAWVLWWHGSLYPSEGPKPAVVGPTWHPLESYVTQRECKLGETAIREESPQFRYVCLPDTVNPRGPKWR